MLLVMMTTTMIYETIIPYSTQFQWLRLQEWTNNYNSARAQIFGPKTKLLSLCLGLYDAFSVSKYHGSTMVELWSNYGSLE